MGSVPEGVLGQLDEGLVEEGFEGGGERLDGEDDDGGGDGAGGDDPAVGESDVRAGGDSVHDGGPGHVLPRFRGDWGKKKMKKIGGGDGGGG